MENCPTEIHCPVCATVIKNEPRLCERCETPHHHDCWEYAGGCALFGCRPGKRALINNDTAALVASMNKWMWAYRAYTKCFVATCFCLSFMFLNGMLTFFMNVIMGFDWAAFGFLVTLMTILHSLVFLVWFVSAMGMAIFIVPAILARRRVNSILHTNLQNTGVMTRGVLDRLELKGVSGVLLSWLTPYKSILDKFVIVGGVTMPLFVGGFIFMGHFGVIYAGVFPLFLAFCFLVAWPLRAVCERLAYFSTVQNRAAASFKGIELVE